MHNSTALSSTALAGQGGRHLAHERDAGRALDKQGAPLPRGVLTIDLFRGVAYGTRPAATETEQWQGRTIDSTLPQVCLACPRLNGEGVATLLLSM